MIPVSVQHHIYLGNDRKAVEVEVDGQWYAGELRSWDQAEDGSGSGVVTWRRAPGELLVRRFPAERIRKAPPPDQQR